MSQRALDPLDRSRGALPRDEVEQQLRIRGAGEDRALLFEMGADLFRVDQVPVVRDRDRPRCARGKERLRILDA